MCSFPINKTLKSVTVARQWTSTIAQSHEAEVLQTRAGLVQASAVSVMLLIQVLREFLQNVKMITQIARTFQALGCYR